MIRGRWPQLSITSGYRSNEPDARMRGVPARQRRLLLSGGLWDVLHRDVGPPAKRRGPVVDKCHASRFGEPFSDRVGHRVERLDVPAARELGGVLAIVGHDLRVRRLRRCAESLVQVGRQSEVVAQVETKTIGASCRWRHDFLPWPRATRRDA